MFYVTFTSQTEAVIFEDIQAFGQTAVDIITSDNLKQLIDFVVAGYGDSNGRLNVYQFNGSWKEERPTVSSASKVLLCNHVNYN